MLAAGSVGAISIVGEYATGLIRTTFAAVPARRAVVVAKVTVVTAVTGAVGVVSATTAFAVSAAVLSGWQADIAATSPDAVRGIAASALLVPVCALVGMGIGALVRHTAPAVVTTTVVLLLPPTTTGSWAVYLVWPLVAALAAVIVAQRRDA